MYRRKIRITKLDVVVTALIVLLAAYIAYRLTMKLNYKWKWSIIQIGRASCRERV